MKNINESKLSKRMPKPIQNEDEQNDSNQVKPPMLSNPPF